jgi:hypothetical protein
MTTVGRARHGGLRRGVSEPQIVNRSGTPRGRAGMRSGKSISAIYILPDSSAT